MLKKANIEHLAKKNFRYRILNVDNEHYLVDIHYGDTIKRSNS